MQFIKEKISTLKNYLNFLIALIPFSFIAGNLIINLNILIFVLSVLFIFKKIFFKSNYI